MIDSLTEQLSSLQNCAQTAPNAWPLREANANSATAFVIEGMFFPGGLDSTV